MAQTTEMMVGCSEDLTPPNMKPPPPRERAVSVAIKGDQDGRPPKVLAVGRDNIAEQILALAFANGIKVREDPDLAELLSAVDLDSDIPLEAFTAVAEILSYVYRANGNIPPGAAVDPADWTSAKGKNDKEDGHD